MASDFQRVTRRNPCPVCGKADWCTRTDRWVYCMRTPGPHVAKNGAYLYPADGLPPVPDHEHDDPTDGTRLTPNEIRARYQRIKCYGLPLDGAAALLNISAKVLDEYGCVAHTLDGDLIVPMYDNHYRMVGVRVRRRTGKKLSWAGSHNGLFLPHPHRLASKNVWAVCEGPTDAMAATKCGVAAIGRPDCASRPDLIAALVRVMFPARLVIFTDNDEAGIRGAQLLVARLMSVPALGVAVRRPPHGIKDVRDWVAQDAKEFVETFRRAGQIDVSAPQSEVG